MWDDDQDGTDEDCEAQANIVSALTDRCARLLKTRAQTIDVVHGDGVQYIVEIGAVIIRFERQRGLWVDLKMPGSDLDGRRVYAQDAGGDGLYIHRKLATEHVLPALEQAMILENLADAGESYGRPDSDRAG